MVIGMGARKLRATPELLGLGLGGRPERHLVIGDRKRLHQVLLELPAVEVQAGTARPAITS
jgi:hypothetical protein